MAKVDFLALKPDNTGTLTRCETKGTVVDVRSSWKPEFAEGRCIYLTEIPIIKLFGRTLWKKTKRFMIAVDGAKHCLEIEKGSTKIEGTSWNWTELEDYIAKVVHLSVVREKAFTQWQIIFLFILMGLNILLSFFGLRGVRFG